jgi:sulfoxide reductase heme-binding subunit YedZ
VVLSWLKARGHKLLVHAIALLPLVWLTWQYLFGEDWVNPVREATLFTGRYAIILLVLCLACTPIYVLFGLRQAIQVRRPLGLYSFVYASLHVLIFVWLDFAFDLSLIVDEVVQRRFVQAGLVTFLLLLPLAVTSTKGWMRRLGRNWKRLHRLIYLAGLVAVLHYVWVAKGDIRVPLVYGAIVVALLVIRIPAVRSAASRLRSRT